MLGALLVFGFQTWDFDACCCHAFTMMKLS
jgi:hypothetical protein